MTTELPTTCGAAVRSSELVRRIGELAIKAHKKRKHADEITERSEAEGWDNDPTGSLHVSEAWSQSDKANAELEESIEALDSPNSVYPTEKR